MDALQKDQIEPTFKVILIVSPKRNELPFNKNVDGDLKILQEISNNPTLNFLYEQIKKLTEKVKGLEESIGKLEKLI